MGALFRLWWQVGTMFNQLSLVQEQEASNLAIQINPQSSDCRSTGPASYDMALGESNITLVQVYLFYTKEEVLYGDCNYGLQGLRHQKMKNLKELMYGMNVL